MRTLRTYVLAGGLALAAGGLTTTLAGCGVLNDLLGGLLGNVSCLDPNDPNYGDCNDANSGDSNDANVGT